MAIYIYNKVETRMQHLLFLRMRNFLLFSLFAFLPFSALAQVGEYRTDFAVGGSAGMTLSNVGFVPEVPQKMLSGMTTGLTFRYTCEKYFKSICALVAEVNYVQTGWRENILGTDDQPVYYVDDTDKSNALFYERKLSYVQIPLLARLGWGRERKGVQAFVQVGPQMGFLLSDSQSTNVDPTRKTATVRSSAVTAQESMSVEKKFDYGIVFGGGIELSFPRVGHFMVEGRYYYGLGNIYKNTKSDYFSKSNLGQVVVKATYLFDLVRTKNDKIK